MNNMNVDYVTLHYRSVLNDFSNQFVNEEFSDCVLNAEGRSLKVHKAMLCAQSSFLEKIVLEHQSIGDLCFIVEGVSFEDLKSVVRFMYNGFTNLTKKKVGSFLVVAELLGVKWLDRIQLLSDTEPSEIVSMNIANENQPNCSKTVSESTTETQSTSVVKSFASSVLKNLTNVLDSKLIKRKKHMKGKKHCQKSKCAKEDHKSDRKKHKIMHGVRHADPNAIKTKEKVPGKETHLTEMDENTFCTALGLKKNIELQPREPCSKPDATSIKTDTKTVAKSRSVPPLIKINREMKSNVENFESRDSNMFVSEINTVYIEDKNLSFLNIGANELCIRENNIEIECDVLDASSSQFVIEKEGTGNIVELREDNIIQAEFVDINPESDAIKLEVQDSEPQVTPPVVVLQVNNIKAPNVIISYPLEDTNAVQAVSVDLTEENQSNKGCDEVSISSTSSEVGGVVEVEPPTSTDAVEDDAASNRGTDVSSITEANDVVNENAQTSFDGERIVQAVELAGGSEEQTTQSADVEGQKTVEQINNDEAGTVIVIDDDVETTIEPVYIDLVGEENEDTIRPAGLDVDENVRSVGKENDDTIRPARLDVDENVRPVGQEDEGIGAIPPVCRNVDEIVQPICAVEKTVNLVEEAVRVTSNDDQAIRHVDGNEINVQSVNDAEEIDFSLDMEEDVESTNDIGEETERHETHTRQRPEAGSAKEIEADCGVEALPGNEDPIVAIRIPVESCKSVKAVELEKTLKPLMEKPTPLQPLLEKPTPLKPLLEKPTYPNQPSEMVRKHFIAVKKHRSSFVYDVPRRKSKRGRSSGPRSVKKKSESSSGQNKPSKDPYQEYLEKTFDLKPFAIKLTKYRNEKEKKESEQMNFLSNFNLRRRGLSPIRQDRTMLRSNYALRTLMHRKFAAAKSNTKRQMTKKHAAPPCKRVKLSNNLCLSNFKSVTVELEKLGDDMFRNRVICEHNYTIDPSDRKLSTDIQLSL